MPAPVEVPERTIPVGFQGEAGAYSQRAVKRLFAQATSVPRISPTVLYTVRGPGISLLLSSISTRVRAGAGRVARR